MVGWITLPAGASATMFYSNCTATGTTTTGTTYWASGTLNVTQCATGSISDVWQHQEALAYYENQRRLGNNQPRRSAFSPPPAPTPEPRIELARERARSLLLSHLTPEQQETFKKNNWFIVTGGKSRKRYKINGNTYAGNVHELRGKGDIAARYCCHCDYTIPLGDQLLAQKIMLEADEDSFLRLANRSAA